jgi:6-phosphofructokinase
MGKQPTSMMKADDKRRETLAILVGGGPAPGINSVIAAAAIEAMKSGLRVVGLREGFRWLAEGDTSHIDELELEDISRIHLTGGTILGTSRTNPAHDEATLERAVGAEIVESLMEDARSTGRWYLAITMGRKSGSLALSMCKSAGATLAVIPEEFRENKFDLAQVIDTIIGAIIKRRAAGDDNGVAVIAEGIAERMDTSALAAAAVSKADPYGHIHIADIPLGILLRDRVHAALKQLGVEVTVVAKDIGYELRCAKPLAFDVEYTRTLGYGAVRYLLGGVSGAVVALAGGRVTPIDFDQLLDPNTGRIRVRTVDVSTESYEVARSYMIRLEPQDFEEPTLSSLAAQTQLSAASFKERFMASARRIGMSSPTCPGVECSQDPSWRQ